MGIYTKYPSQIDSSNELPLTVDNVTPIRAEVPNRLREAILAIEAELGIDPSREYATVRARIDAIEQALLEIDTGGGSGGEVVPTSKIRVFRATSALAGSAAGLNQTAVWNGASTLVSTVTAGINGGLTALVAQVAGPYCCSGQLTIQPTANIVTGLVIEILLNGATVIHTMNDFGSTWGIGFSRSFSFAFPIDLVANDTLSIRWRHSGGTLSATQIMTGESLSWFAMNSL